MQLNTLPLNTLERAIILDTETTGLDPKQGHRLVEIGCIEICNYMPTGRTYQQYINPERDVPIEAYNVHGLSFDKLKKFPIFSEIAHKFVDFIGDAPLIIHNAPFDLKFLNAELQTVNLSAIDRKRVICTLELAKRTFPGARVSLDELCKKFKIDASNRTKHGALLDAELLAKVYIELMGGRQTGLNFSQVQPVNTNDEQSAERERKFHEAREHPIDPKERALHHQLLDKIKNALWKRLQNL